MKTALINPPWPHSCDPMLWGVRAGSRWPHFQPRSAPGLLPRYIPFPFFLAIAARLLKRAGHDVLLLDGVAENMSLDIFFRRMESFKPGLIFLETSTPSLKHDMNVITSLRRYCPEAKLAAGGTHPASLAAQVLKQPGAPDYWIAGEYELILVSLANALDSGTQPHDIPGIITLNESGYRLASSPDVKALPLPLFEQLPIAAYSDPVCGLPAPGAQSWLSRGCPFACTFCVWPQVIYGNRRYRPRPIKTALDEVEVLINRYHCESFYFDDDTANLGEARMLDLSSEIRRRGLDAYPWAMMARADCMTARILKALADAGMYSVKYGVESPSPGLLNACDKATRWGDLQTALIHTRELGIKIHLTFTLGLPGETPESIRQTIRFALDTLPDTAQFSICTPFPGTAFYEECRSKGWLITEDWERFLGSGEAVIQTPWLTASELTAGYHEALDAWRRAEKNRLETRQRNLVARLRRAVTGGRRWRLLGDDDFASFLERQAPDLTPSRIDKAGDDDIAIVIISRHDEEKIRRRLLRAGTGKMQEIIGLWGQPLE